MVRLSELSHQDDAISVQLNIRNLNDDPLDLTGIDFKLVAEETELLVYKGPAEANIAPNGTETWSIQLAESEAGRTLLDSLQSGEVKSLPYTLNGVISTVDTGSLRFEHEGHLYPLPGRPGHFR